MTTKSWFSIFNALGKLTFNVKLKPPCNEVQFYNSFKESGNMSLYMGRSLSTAQGFKPISKQLRTASWPKGLEASLYAANMFAGFTGPSMES